MMDYVWAFVVGGGICLLGQILLDTTKLTAPRILVIFVVSGVVLQALGLYEKLVELAGSGAVVPLPGFGYNLAKGAIEGAREGLLAAVMGPVKAAAGGISLAVSFGYVTAMVCSPRSPKGNK